MNIIRGPVMIGLVFGIGFLFAGGPKDYKINHISLAEGLSQSTVTSIVQDRKGFMWFGTADGLNQYNGYTFTHHKYDPEDPESLSNNLVMDICEGSDGSLWVGTRGMLNRFHPHKNTFTRYAHDPNDPASLSDNEVRTIYQDRAGFLWVGTARGLNKMDVTTGQVTRYLHDPANPNSLSHDTIHSVHEDSRGNIWVGTTEGLNRLDPVSGEFTRYAHDPRDPGSISDNTAWAILEDHRGQLWIGTAAGLNRFDPETDSFERWYHDPENRQSLSHDYIRDLMEDRENRLWVATYGGGLTRVSFDDEGEVASFAWFQHDPESDVGLSGDRVGCLFEDRTGIVWAGLDVLGLNTLDENAAKFYTEKYDPNSDNTLTFGNVSSLYEDRDGILWIGTWQDGLNRLDRNTGQYTHYQRDPNGSGKGMIHNQVPALLEDRNGAFWVGGEKGLSLMDRDSGTFTNYIHDPRDPDSIGQGSVWAIHEDRDGVLRVGLQGGGLNEFDRENERFIRYDHDVTDPKSISSNFLRAIYQDEAGRIWVGTFRGGLNQFKPGSGEFVHYRYDPGHPDSISHDMILVIYERQDHPGILWIGTHGGGLNRFDTATGTFRRFTEQNSDLPSNVVYGILDDEMDRLWLSTNKGIARFKPESNNFQNYDVDDGLQSKEFNQGAYFKSPSGELFFGGINGFNSFLPHEIKENNYPPLLAFTDFKLFGESVSVGGNSPLEAHISETREIILAHDQNDISIEFVALHYSRPENNHYRYMLKPYDSDWSPESAQRIATYTNLDSGTYTFMMKAANNDGIWNEEGISLRLVIKPPWWRTVWAYLLYSGLLIGFLVMADRLQRTRVLRAERARAQLQESKLRAEAAELKTRAMEAQSKALQAEKERNELERVALEAENARKNRELEEARQLQLSMLPRRVPAPPHLEIAVFMETATEVGGDYYDFHQNAEGNLTVAIGDATGHGLRAGTMVAATKSLFNALVDEPDPVVFLKKASQYLKEMGFRKMYMAFLLAKIKQREMVLASAGMPHPLVYRAREKRLEEIEVRGLPLGSIAGYPYENVVVPFEKGDLIILMSDGMQELFNPEEKMLGTERIKEQVLKAIDEAPNRIIKHLVRAGKTWGEGRPHDDDITILVLKVI